MAIAPITPDEVATGAGAVPDVVLAAFNGLLAERARNGRSRFTQNEVIARIQEGVEAAGSKISRQEIFAKHYLDVESIYRAAGWQVRYDAPGYNESYEAFFEFSTA
ncbi:hypothetical protein OCH239_09755 [Roseivivax halodurans JCM 10272]|uniref:Uncharacterized protein n=1 Tax=Roseivivax halodurans JCM 10272 TaxID=1449350 RepID=X7EBT9_9RHOB|nr:hypothetical protein [Roseivivax halodurans]ETX13554.1 hypothetical protein OCH239_09755 [Roseivivax halodurans JCM 10272]